ncbi:hypothetical protein Tco_0882383 [Tanacetum coccineum]
MTTNRNKPEKQISVAKKPERQILTGHRFSIKKTSVVHEKIKTHRSCLRWKPTGRILKTVGLRWVPIGKIFTSSTTMVDSEPHMVPIQISLIFMNAYKLLIQVRARHHGPSDAMHNPSQPFKFLSTDTCLICYGDTFTNFYWSFPLRVILFSFIVTNEKSLPGVNSNRLSVGTNDRVATSFQQSLIHYHMLMPKLQRHTISIKKAYELKTKTFASSDIQDLPLRYQVYHGRLLASFQDDAKYEHVGQDTRSQDGKHDKDIQGKDLKISKLKTKSKDNDKG